MRKIMLACILSVLIACAGDSKDSLAEREAALEIEARQTAAASLEEQSSDVQARYREASRQAQELMRQHAKERLDELLEARSSLAKSAAKSAQLSDLDLAIAAARKQQQRVEQGRGSKPPAASGKSSP